MTPGEDHAGDVFAGAATTELDNANAGVGASDNEFSKALDQARVTRATQDNTHRQWFVKWVIGIVTGSLLAGVGIMGCYVTSEWREVSPSVLVAWFSASVVQTIGLAYVIARYLFPEAHE